MKNNYVILCNTKNHQLSSLKDSEIGQLYIINSDELAIDQKYYDLFQKLMTQLKDILNEIHTKQEIFIQFVLFTNDLEDLNNGLSSFFKTLELEYPFLSYQMIQIEEINASINLNQILIENLRNKEDREVLYRNGNRFVKKLEEIEIRKDNFNSTIWKENGVYLITGGLGGLGKIFVQEITLQLKSSTIFLIGRSSLTTDRKKEIERLEKYNNRIVYVQSDVTNKAKMQQVINNIIQKCGKINGIIHAAGTIDDQLFVNKDCKNSLEVMNPKVTGTIVLDECTSCLDIDFMVLFSSGVGELGNVGQIDYGVANSFLDNFSNYRNSLVEKNMRLGKTLAIAWPLWEEGGMTVTDEVKEWMYQSLGMMPMQTNTGVQAFYNALLSEHSQVLVMEGDIEKFNTKIQTEQEVKTRPDSTITNNELETIDDIILEIFVENSRLAKSKIDRKKEFSNYGVNSIQIMKMNTELKERFEDVGSTVFFESTCLDEVIAKVKEQVGEDSVSVSQTNVENKEKVNQALKKMESQKKQLDEETSEEEVAIIGMSGKFSEATCIPEFKKLLETAAVFPKEVPNNRWDANLYFESFDKYNPESDTSYSKWGFFLDDVFSFDSLFFNISPVKAQYIDPQERLFLEECWKAVVDAGYTSDYWANIDRKKIGVYGAITKTGFNLWNPKNSTSFSSLVNRFSFFMNFQGPSLSFDTMCSSSLVAIEHATRDISLGIIDVAIVGGTNLYLHPNNYINLSQNNMISKLNKNPFSSDDDIGFMPSEGCGAIVLKRLSKAKEDGDDILSVIKSVKVSHSGKTSRYFMPSSNRQSQVMIDALESASMSDADIDHVEISINGSSIADSSEMEAIKNVYPNNSLGALKSLIGNGEAVSGIEQTIKSILQFKNNTIFPSLTYTTEPNFKEKQMSISNKSGAFLPRSDENPRRIGINSFGAGGTYAHMIIEEYQYSNRNNVLSEWNDDSEEFGFPFSGRTKAALDETIKLWLIFLENEQPNIKEVSYILSNKRERFENKFITFSHSIDDLKENLKDYLEEKDNKNNLVLVEWGNSFKLDNNRRMKFVKSWVGGEFSSSINISGFPTYEFAGKSLLIQSNQGTLPKKEMPSNLISIEDYYLSKQDDENESSIADKIIEVLKRILLMDETDQMIKKETSFFDLGIDSVLIEKFVDEVNQELNVKISNTDIFSYSDINQLTEYIKSIQNI